jgi:hypothetical protein
VQESVPAAGSVVPGDADLVRTNTYVQVILALVDAIALRWIEELGVGHRVDLFGGEVPGGLDSVHVDVRRRLPARGGQQADAQVGPRTDEPNLVEIERG